MNKAPKFLFTKSKLKALIMLVLISFSFVIIAPKPVHAQTDFNQAINNILTPIWEFLKKAYEKGGAAAFQTTVRTALNKIAYDTANWIGSGAQGQKPLFVTQGWGDYLAQVGDEAAGQFLEQAVSNWQSADQTTTLRDQCSKSYEDCKMKCSMDTLDIIDDNKTYDACMDTCESNLWNCSGVTTTNDGVTAAKGGVSPARSVCRPSSIEARLQIAMGLVDNQRPQAPNCSASELVENWDNYYQKLTNFRDPSFLNKFANIFNPVSNDLGIYMTLRANSQEIVDVKETDAERSLIADGGWLDMRDIAGNLTGLPGDAARKTELAEQGYINNMAEFSGDALIDAANVFLNQLALSSFNRLMSGLGKTVTNNSSANLSNPSSDPNIRYGEGTVRESAASIIEPDFTTRADYDILVSLSMCRDRNNPGPTECVIDDRLMQGITEKKTVAEAVQAGYLRREWQFTSEYREGTYNLRNLQIMRKYRIVPIGWEVAAQMNKKATLIDLMSCFSGSDEYNEYSSGFDVRNQSWCRGLVDPNWVLKAPLNYCAKQGYSAQILSVNIIPSAGLNGQTTDEVQMLRADNYCADDQTCINENADGSCEAYGYCLSERRTWNFNSPSCEPIDNTCSSFVNSNSGIKVAYLENTLDYGDCTADSIGCQRYSTNGSYNLTQAQVTWSANPFSNAYFNSKLTDCSSSSESCSEMMRVKPGWGSNLVMGADFAQDNIGDTAIGGRINNYWNIWSDSSFEAEIIDTATLDGISLGKAIQASSNGDVVGVYSNNAVSLIPSNLNVLSGETYTLSADVYLVAGEKVHAVLGDDYEKFVETRDQEVWRHLSVTRSLKEQPLSELAFQIVAYNESGPVDFAVRNIKLEMNSYDSGFSLYGAYKVYQKLIPNYLYDVCYVDARSSSPDYRLKENAPAICNNFARQCNLEEAGCERFTEADSGFSVAAKAVTTDYCDASCNNYDIYVTRASYFYAPQIEKIIPQNSEECNAQAVGCSEFTNLDVVASGGEGREYYTQLKQCIKPGADCADFYSWVGTEESGYQLKSYVLKKDNSGNPATTFDNTDLCNESIFNLPSNHPSFNPDCRQYYNKAGQISYRLTASTITCSENCHTYRLSENNVDATVAQADCSGSDRFWNINNSACYVCQNGGTWSNQYQACLYQAIPNEGIKCSAAQNGCREYNGSSGNNTRLIAAHSFDNDLEGFEGQCGDDAVYSNVANSNNGKSLMYDRGANASGSQQTTNCDQNNVVTWLDKIMGTAQAAPASFVRKIVGKTVSQGKAYSLKFTASAASDTSVYFSFLNSNDDITYFNASSNNATGNITISGNSEWKTYELNLSNLDHVVDNKEALVVVADKDFYLDNLVLTEITNRYYLIKNTSQIPDVCYYDMLDNYQGVDYNLGCSLYTDRFNNSHYLRQFSQLCQDSAVGCELMIDTANYDNFKGNIWKDLNENGLCDASEPECMQVEGDRFFYAIYDESKLCNSADLGCSRLGASSNSGQNLAWSDVFKRNNPNQYDQILCNASEAGCEAWQYSDGRGTAYFKNPGNDVCVYRNSTNPENTAKAWYKAPVMRCDLNESGVIDANEIGTKICASSNDCAANRPCILDNNDYECPVSYLETFGVGGGGKQVPVPSDSAALCTTAASGCTEYIDPISSFATNLVKDPNYDDNSNVWSNGSQQVAIEPNSLYIFSVETDNSSLSNNVRLEPEIGVLLLEENNNLGDELQTELIIPSGQPDQRFIFHSRNNTKVTIFGPNKNHEIILKKAIIDYQLQQNIDKSSCNGLVNTNNGCILFNERSVNGAQGLLPLSGAWNAAASNNGQAPQLCSSGNCDSNTLIKVRPDRTCASWLDCVTYVLDPETNQRTCYALGECNALNDQGECINFVESGDSVLTANNLDLTKNTGYSILDQYSIANMKEVGLNTTAHYSFEDASPTLYCSLRNKDGECIVNESLQADYIINSPTNAPTDYPAEGKAYLRVMAGQMIAPHSITAPISVQQDTDYYLNFLVNTKNSGASATILIFKYNEDKKYWNKTPLNSPQYFIANEGWERQVISFNTDDAEKIVIYLTSSSTSLEERYVYFDDINIEPVLQVGDDKYIAKECRLYPNQNAISCSSVNNQVVQDGLVGYCLQHDPANKNVCLLWYPIDSISASMTSGRSSLGYQGAFPLNYCVEANGGFELVEKRKAYYMGNFDEEVKDIPSSYDCFDWYCFPGGSGDCGGGDCCSVSNNIANGLDYICPVGYTRFSAQYEYNDNHDDRCHIDFWCVPDNSLSKKIYVDIFEEATNCNFQLKEQWWTPVNLSNKQYIKTSSDYVNGDQVSGGKCGKQIRIKTETEGWYQYNSFHANESQNADPAIRVYDLNYPTTDEDQLKLISSDDPEQVYYPTCNRFVQVVDNDGNNQAWVDRVSKSSAYPYQTPLFFRDEDYYYGLSAYCYIEEEYCVEECACGNHCECWQNGENCMHPCDYVGDCLIYDTVQTVVDCSTPGAIQGGLNEDAFNLTAYGRNRELVPFGAATFPDDFNIFASEPVKLRTQYSAKIDQKVFAGRPYDCIGVGCNNIGYCSLNPNVYCLLDDTDSANESLVNQQSCGSANGTCVPLWNGDKVANKDIINSFNFQNVLKNVFLTSYDGYQFNIEESRYVSHDGYLVEGYNTFVNQLNSSCINCHTTNNDKNFNAYWKRVLPIVQNVKINGADTNSTIQIDNPGIYTLTFNTIIDKEQQPLRDLFITWGDGEYQNLVNQNHHPDSTQPHTVYHYYKNAGSYNLKIRITDNWGFYDDWPN